MFLLDLPELKKFKPAYAIGNPCYDKIQSIKKQLERKLFSNTLSVKAFQQQLITLQPQDPKSYKHFVIFIIALQDLKDYLSAQKIDAIYHLSLLQSLNLFFSRALQQSGNTFDKKTNARMPLTLRNKTSSPTFFEKLMAGALIFQNLGAAFPDKEFLISQKNSLESQEGGGIAAQGTYATVIWNSQNAMLSTQNTYLRTLNQLGDFVTGDIKVNQCNNSQISFNNDAKIVWLTQNKLIAIWAIDSECGEGEDIYGRFFDLIGNPLSEEFRINSITRGSQKKCAVTILPTVFLVTWESQNANRPSEQDNSNKGVFGQLFNYSGNQVGAEFQINTHIANAQFNCKTAPLDEDKFISTWLNFNPASGLIAVCAQIFSIALANNQPTRIGVEIVIVDGLTSILFDNPFIALENNNYLIAWIGTKDNNPDVNIYAKIIKFEGNTHRFITVKDSFQINTFSNNLQYNPQSLKLPNKHFLIAWDSINQPPDNSYSGVFGQVFNEAGEKVGNEFIINDYSKDSQNLAGMAVFDNGNILVGWKSINQVTLNSGLDLFGKIIETHSTIMNLDSTLTYQTKLGRLFAKPPIINTPIFIDKVAVTVTLMPATIGSLMTQTADNVTSIYDTETGIWQASGNVDSINHLLANLTLQQDNSEDFSLSVKIDDGFNLPLATEVNFRTLSTTTNVDNTNNLSEKEKQNKGIIAATVAATAGIGALLSLSFLNRKKFFGKTDSTSDTEIMLKTISPDEEDPQNNNGLN